MGIFDRPKKLEVPTGIQALKQYFAQPRSSGEFDPVHLTQLTDELARETINDPGLQGKVQALLPVLKDLTRLTGGSSEDVTVKMAIAAKTTIVTRILNSF